MVTPPQNPQQLSPASSDTQTAPVKKFKKPLIIASIIVGVVIVLSLAFKFS
jgi:hypothetical protein